MNRREGEEERPWNEALWEEFMKRSDARSTRYGELFENLIDHPDRDEIIHKEIGWDQQPDDWEDKHGEELIGLFSGARIIAAKIAGGHFMGYGDDSL